MNSPVNSLGLLDRDDAARLLGVSVKTLRRFVREGLLRPVRYSRTARLRFREADLRQFIEDRTRPAAGRKAAP